MRIVGISQWIMGPHGVFDDYDSTVPLKIILLVYNGSNDDFNDCINKADAHEDNELFLILPLKITYQKDDSDGKPYSNVDEGITKELIFSLFIVEIQGWIVHNTFQDAVSTHRYIIVQEEFSKNNTRKIMSPVEMKRNLIEKGEQTNQSIRTNYHRILPIVLIGIHIICTIKRVYSLIASIVREILPRITVLGVISIVGVWSRIGTVSHQRNTVSLFLQLSYSPQAYQHHEQLNSCIDKAEYHGPLECLVSINLIDGKKQDAQSQEKGKIGCEHAEESPSSLSWREIPISKHSQEHEDKHFLQFQLQILTKSSIEINYKEKKKQMWKESINNKSDCLTVDDELIVVTVWGR